MTGKKSAKNIHIYQKHGYGIVREEERSGIVLIWMEKVRSAFGATAGGGTVQGGAQEGP